MTTFAPPHIQELYQKCYGRGEELLCRLIKTVTFQLDDYELLQHTLTEASPTRFQAQYEGKQMEIMKERVLDSILSRQANGSAGANDHVDDATSIQDSASVQDDEIPLPATVNILDLRPLKLRSSPFMESLILVRREYDKIVDHLRGSNPRVKSRGSRLFTGQPGIGKTYFLYYYFILLLLEKRTFAFQFNDQLYWIDPTGIQAINNLYDAPFDDILVLVDLPSSMARVTSSICLSSETRCRIICATSSRNAKDCKWINDYKRGQVHCLPTWSWQEYFVTGTFLHPRDLTPRRLLNAFTKFGPMPRTCFRASISEVKERNTSDETERIINKIPFNEPLEWKLHDLLDSVVPLRQLFAINPSSGQIGSRICVKPLSLHIMDGIIKHYEERSANSSYHLIYQALRNHNIFHPVAECVLERAFHAYMTTGPPPLLVLRSLDAPSQKQTLSLNCSPRSCTFMNPRSLTTHVHSILQKKEPCYLKPLSSNSIDALLILPSGTFKVDSQASNTPYFILLPNTSTNRHAITPSDLQDIQAAFHGDGGVASLLPTPISPWHIVFIPPEDKVDTYKSPLVLEEEAGDSPPLERMKSESVSGSWRDKTRQYALIIDYPAMFSKLAAVDAPMAKMES